MDDLTPAAFAAPAIHHCCPEGIPREPLAVVAPVWQQHPAITTVGVQNQMGMNRVSAEDSVVTAGATANHFELGGLRATANRPVFALGIAGWTEALCVGCQGEFVEVERYALTLTPLVAAWILSRLPAAAC